MRAPEPKASDPVTPLSGTSSESLRGGDRIDRFVILKTLGRGSTGAVYAVMDIESGEALAIKRAQPLPWAADRPQTEEATAASIRREAEMLSRIHHPAVPRLIEMGEGPPPYLVLEFIDGVDLEQFLSSRRDPLSQSELVGLLESLAGALEAVHRQGLLHGDLKPSNVIISPDGNPVVIDFGAARRWEGLGDASAVWSLTPGYAAPECHDADGAPGPWSDVYSLGAIAYRVVTGRHPLSAEVRVGGDSMPSAVNTGADAYSLALLAAIDWALELDPAARPRSSRECIDAIHAAAVSNADAGDAYPPTLRIRRRRLPERPVRDEAQTTAARSDRRSRRRRMMVLTLAGLAVLGFAGWAGHGYYQRHVKREWIVDAENGDAATIAEALTQARDGATILVQPGTYPESLVIERPVDIMGVAENGGHSVIQPADGHCIRVTAPASRLSGLVLRGPERSEGGAIALPCLDVTAGRVSVENIEIAAFSGPAVMVRDGAEAKLSDSVVSGSGTVGILLTSGAKVNISGGEIRNTAKSGIVARGGADITIAGATIADAGEAGLLLAEGATGQIRASSITGSRTSGIEITGGAKAVIFDSRVEASAQAGVFVTDGGRAALEKAQISDNAFSGVIIGSAGEIRAFESLIRGNGEHGILVLDLAKGIVENSRILENAGYGIVALRTAQVEATGNTVEGNREPQVIDANEP
jgi:nitrous oxidase accessory protein NosD/predicted Ser/Thr protein kinase